MIIRTHAFPRAGLIGNPSDGYFGKTLAFCFTNFRAEIELWESPDLELVPSRRDHSVFEGLRNLHHDVKLHGYYGGFRLLKASCKVFLDYCEERGIELDNRNFTLRYRSDIPNRVGLAGSSAIITACLRALMGFYGVKIPASTLANLILSVETEELSIPAGLQDRVAQAHQHPVYMDFRRELMEARGYGEYEAIDLSAVAPYLYIAYREDLSQGTEVYHSDLKTRYRQGDEEVRQAIATWADLTRQFRERLEAKGGGDLAEQVAALGQLLDKNFDLRASLYDVGDGNRQLIEVARNCGCSAKFAGSGGAVVGLLPADGDAEEALACLERGYAGTNVRVLRPRLWKEAVD